MVLTSKINYPWHRNTQPDGAMIEAVNQKYGDHHNVIPDNPKTPGIIVWRNLDTGVEIVARVLQSNLDAAVMRYTVTVELTSPALEGVTQLDQALKNTIDHPLEFEGFAGEARELCEFVETAVVTIEGVLKIA
jgi:hypothetical protein